MMRLYRPLLFALVAALTLVADAAFAAGPLDTFTVTPCRIVDTRFIGGYPGVAIPANGTSNYVVSGNTAAQGGAPSCGVPDGIVKAVLLNVVVVTPNAPGYLTIYPWPSSLPGTSNINFNTGQTIANGALIAVCDENVTSPCTYDFSVTVSQASAHVVVDITGYMMASP